MLRYTVTADYLPFRRFFITAGSESEARLTLSKRLGIPYEETSASLEAIIGENNEA